MTTLMLDDKLSSDLEAIAGEKGLDVSQLVTQITRRYIAAEKAKRILQNPELIRLYEEELAEEDVALAEEGMADYNRMLMEADKE